MVLCKLGEYQAFQSTLSMRRATAYFCTVPDASLFQSTLSMRRATGLTRINNRRITDFNPRSP